MRKKNKQKKVQESLAERAARNDLKAQETLIEQFIENGKSEVTFIELARYSENLSLKSEKGAILAVKLLTKDLINSSKTFALSNLIGICKKLSYGEALSCLADFSFKETINLLMLSLKKAEIKPSFIKENLEIDIKTTESGKWQYNEKELTYKAISKILLFCGTIVHEDFLSQKIKASLLHLNSFRKELFCCANLHHFSYSSYKNKKSITPPEHIIKNLSLFYQFFIFISSSIHQSHTSIITKEQSTESFYALSKLVKSEKSFLLAYASKDYPDLIQKITKSTEKSMQETAKTITETISESQESALIRAKKEQNLETKLKILVDLTNKTNKAATTTLKKTLEGYLKNTSTLESQLCYDLGSGCNNPIIRNLFYKKILQNDPEVKDYPDVQKFLFDRYIQETELKVKQEKLTITEETALFFANKLAKENHLKAQKLLLDNIKQNKTQKAKKLAKEGNLYAMDFLYNEYTKQTPGIDKKLALRYGKKLAEDGFDNYPGLYAHYLFQKQDHKEIAAFNEIAKKKSYAEPLFIFGLYEEIKTTQEVLAFLISKGISSSFLEEQIGVKTKKTGEDQIHIYGLDMQKIADAEKIYKLFSVMFSEKSNFLSDKHLLFLKDDVFHLIKEKIKIVMSQYYLALRVFMEKNIYELPTRCEWLTIKLAMMNQFFICYEFDISNKIDEGILSAYNLLKNSKIVYNTEQQKFITEYIAKYTESTYGKEIITIRSPSTFVKEITEITLKSMTKTTTETLNAIAYSLSEEIDRITKTRVKKKKKKRAQPIETATKDSEVTETEKKPHPPVKGENHVEYLKKRREEEEEKIRQLREELENKRKQEDEPIEEPGILLKEAGNEDSLEEEPGMPPLKEVEASSENDDITFEIIEPPRKPKPSPIVIEEIYSEEEQSSEEEIEDEGPEVIIHPLLAEGRRWRDLNLQTKQLLIKLYYSHYTWLYDPNSENKNPISKTPEKAPGNYSQEVEAILIQSKKKLLNPNASTFIPRALLYSIHSTRINSSITEDRTSGKH